MDKLPEPGYSRIDHAPSRCFARFQPNGGVYQSARSLEETEGPCDKVLEWFKKTQGWSQKTPGELHTTIERPHKTIHREYYNVTKDQANLLVDKALSETTRTYPKK